MSTGAPKCPACDLPVGTPTHYPWGECTAANGYGGPRESTLWCPACGHGWVGTAEDVAQAMAALREYDEREGFPWRDESHS